VPTNGITSKIVLLVAATRAAFKVLKFISWIVAWGNWSYVMFATCFSHLVWCLVTACSVRIPCGVMFSDGLSYAFCK
jgi:hypothetical protein